MTRITLLLTALVLSLSSCVVSKKKYEALLLEKNQIADDLDKKSAESKQLKVNLENAIADYESMKNDFGKSNALKTDEISDLMIMVTQLKDESEQLNQKLSETVSKFKAKEADSYMANEELDKTIKAVNTLKRDTASLNYSLQLAKQRNKMLQDELKTSQEKASTSGLQRIELQKQVDKQTAQLKDMEKQLIKSQQNMSEVSSAFIELRKAMLKANSSNTAIDPNKSKEVDKVAKLLGHY
ncbi:hypothetical protein KDU71_21280 [Carboxylicivirga sediminis]|uniref:Lipoprotein n=1 Tax=Carboxylicivirga sediminis TaxID=2006564 RepID=A0A941F7L4_9BACT|nr:hypothetical protein [Carboxylicivirga sediminis]MBR8538117.1 hypothetical protein [Carboxylicivirga sediminis]